MIRKKTLEELFAECRERKKKEKEKIEMNKKYLQYSSKKEFRGKEDTYFSKNRDLITGKQNYKRKINKMKEQLEIRWKIQTIKKL